MLRPNVNLRIYYWSQYKKLLPKMPGSIDTIGYSATQGANVTTATVAIASILLCWCKSWHKYFFIELAGLIFRKIADKNYVEKIFEFKK